MALELRSYKKRNEIPDKTCALWFLYLSNLQTLPHLGRLWIYIDRTFNKKNKLKNEEKDEYLNGLCTLSNPTEKENKLSCNVSKVENNINFTIKIFTKLKVKDK